MIESLLAIALAIAVPLGLRHAKRMPDGEPSGRVTAATLAVGSAIVALALPRGPLAAWLAAPWLAVALAIGLPALGRIARRMVRAEPAVDVADLGIVAALGFLAVGAVWLVLDRAAFRPFGFATTIVLLSAVHFHVAGFVLTVAGALVARKRPGAASRLALGTLIVGMALTAAGFLGPPLVGWIGAILVAAAGIAIGLGQVGVARSHAGHDRSRRLVAVGGASLVVTMPLAAAYATGATFGIPFLDIPAMAAIHGTVNVLGFAVPSMVGWGGIGR